MRADPVLDRELRLHARRPLVYALRAGGVAATAAILWQMGRTSPLVSALGSVSENAALGRRLFDGLSWILFGFSSVSALAAGADSVVREARAGTLGLLVLTPIGEGRLIRGKWWAAMTQAFLAALSAAPALAACAYLGGVSSLDLVSILLTSLGSAALAAAFGIRASVTCDGVAAALFQGALRYVGWALVPVVVALPTAGVGLIAGVFVHPLYAAVMLDDPAYSRGLAVSAWSSLVLSLVLCGRSLSVSATKLSRRLREMPDPEVLDPSADPIPTDRFLSWIPGRTRRGDPWDDAPQLWKDLATRPAAKLPLGGRLLVFVVAPIACYFLLLSDQGRHLGIFSTLGAGFTACALLAGASLFAPERDRRTLDLLLASPLPARRIVGAKLLSGFLAPEAFLLVLFAGFSVLAYASRTPASEGIVLFGAVCALFLGSAYLAGAAASLSAPGSASAFVRASLGLALLVTLLPDPASPLPVLSALRRAEPDALARAARFLGFHAALVAALWAWLVGRLRA